MLFCRLLLYVCILNPSEREAEVKIKKIMNIPKHILKEWSALRERGDVQELERLANVSHVTVRKALNAGKCNERVFKAISGFYRERKKLLQWK